MAADDVTRFEAVVFDLFGTLVNDFSRAGFYGMVRDVAREVGADPDAFEQGWTASSVERQTGVYPTVEANVRAICTSLGLDPDDAAIARALRRREEMYRRHFRPRPMAEETLGTLKEAGYQVGLISMCAPDAPALWRACPLAPLVDVAVFSSEVGLRKPDPAIFLLACTKLGVEPERCLYVGDGAYGELTGASAVGMHPVMVRDAGEVPGEALRPEDEDWDGPTIASLDGIWEFLGG